MIERQTDKKFDLVSKYTPTGDQPAAINQLVTGVEEGKKAQILLGGATGTGKTFTISNVIKEVNRPTLFYLTIKPWRDSYTVNLRSSSRIMP